MIGLFPVFHKILLSSKRRINVDETNLPARPKAIRSLLVGEQFAQGREIVTPHKQIAPAIVSMRMIRTKRAHELPWSSGRLRQYFLAAHFAIICESVLFTGLWQI